MKRSKKSGKKNKGQGSHAGHRATGSATHNTRSGPKEDDKEEEVFCVKQSATIGRYLVSSRSLSAGQVVLEDPPLVVGPVQEAAPLCLGCYESLSLHDTERCAGCHWPLCSATCPGLQAKHGHSRAECDLLAKSGAKEGLVEAWYYAITPLRCLALKVSDPAAWEVIKTMESHDEARRAEPELWSTNQRLVVDRLRNAWGLERFSEDEIHFVCGVLEVNCFEVASSGARCLRAIYPRASLFAHDCVPNTSHCDIEDYRMVVRAAVAVPRDVILTVSYTYTLQSTLKRRGHLRSTKFFECRCRRCTDAAELGTFAGALKCPVCRGTVLSESPLNEAASWKCTCCSYRTEAERVTSLMTKLTEELDAIDGNDVAGYEKFLKTHSLLLHDNHYQCLSALHSLSELYGKVTGYLINDLTDEQLERKIEICRQLLQVFSVLEPGLSKRRGILLYELQAPMMVLMRRKFEQQNFPKKDLKARLREICKYLEESHKILSGERVDSTEGRIARAARDSLDSLCSWQDIVTQM